MVEAIVIALCKLCQSKCWTWGLHQANVLFTISVTFLKWGCETLASTWICQHEAKKTFLTKLAKNTACSQETLLLRYEPFSIFVREALDQLYHHLFERLLLHIAKLKGNQICQEFWWSLIFLFLRWFSSYPRWGHLLCSLTIPEKSLAPGTLKPFTFSLLSLQVYSSGHDAVIGTTAKVKGHPLFWKMQLWTLESRIDWICLKFTANSLWCPT